MIPHLTLVAMLAADRAAAAGGDVGGYLARGADGTLVERPADPADMREHCPVHGWVGRAAFQRDGHGFCVPAEYVGRPVCSSCEGARHTSIHSSLCARCDGSGYEPVVVEDEPGPVGVNRNRWLNDDMVHPAISIEMRRPKIGLDGEVIDVERMRLGREARGHERAETTSVKQLKREGIAAGWEEIIAIDAAEPGFVEPRRPRTRAECGDERPCPWVSCRHHLALDINPTTGSIKLVFPDIEPWELKHSCSLDAADLGGHVLDAVGEKLNITRERARQLEVRASRLMKQALRAQRVAR